MFDQTSFPVLSGVCKNWPLWKTIFLVQLQPRKVGFLISLFILRLHKVVFQPGFFFFSLSLSYFASELEHSCISRMRKTPISASLWIIFSLFQSSIFSISVVSSQHPWKSLDQENLVSNSVGGLRHWLWTATEFLKQEGERFAIVKGNPSHGCLMEW